MFVLGEAKKGAGFLEVAGDPVVGAFADGDDSIFSAFSFSDHE